MNPFQARARREGSADQGKWEETAEAVAAAVAASKGIVAPWASSSSVVDGLVAAVMHRGRHASPLGRARRVRSPNGTLALTFQGARQLG